ncbi:MAG: hypothetical protein ABIN91_12140 [Mucilaginibacter sp.]
MPGKEIWSNATQYFSFAAAEKNFCAAIELPHDQYQMLPLLKDPGTVQLLNAPDHS